MAYKISDACIKCGACEGECPVSAISEGDAKDFCRKVVWSSCDYETDMDSFRSTRKEILEYLSR